MRGNPGPAYNPRHYTRGYSRELIADHVGECLSIYHDLDSEHGIPAELATSVFGVVQAMVAAVEPVAGTPPAVARANGNGLVVVEGADAARLAREA